MANYKFAHVHVLSRDPLKKLEFYTKVLGAKIVSEVKLPDDRNVTELDIGWFKIVLSEQRPIPWVPRLTGIDHICLDSDNFEETVKDVKEIGLKIVNGPQYFPKGQGPAKEIVVAFPDNVLVSITGR